MFHPAEQSNSIIIQHILLKTTNLDLSKNKIAIRLGEAKLQTVKHLLCFLCRGGLMGLSI